MGTWTKSKWLWKALKTTASPTQLLEKSDFQACKKRWVLQGNLKANDALLRRRNLRGILQEEMHRHPQQGCSGALTVWAVYLRQCTMWITRHRRPEETWEWFKHAKWQQIPKVPELLARSFWVDVIQGPQILVACPPTSTYCQKIRSLWSHSGASVIQRLVCPPFCFGYINYKILIYTEYSALLFIGKNKKLKS